MYLGRIFALYFFASYMQGISGLECYQCNDVPHPQNCNNTKMCEDVHEICITAEDVNDRFMLSYKLGCTTREFCDGGLVLFGRRKRNLRHACCSFDLCNKYDITSITSQSTHSTKHISASKITTHMTPTATSQPSQTTREVPTTKTTARIAPTTTSQPSQTTREVPTTKTTAPIAPTTTPEPSQTTREVPTTKTTPPIAPTTTPEPRQTTRELPTTKTTAHIRPTTTAEPRQTTRQILTTKTATQIAPTTTSEPLQTSREVPTTKTATHITSTTTVKTSHETTPEKTTTPFPCTGHNFYHWNQTCFFLQTKQENWASSVNSCKSVSMELAVIREGDKHKAIVHFVEDILKLNHRQYAIWLGAHYDTNSNHWQWIDGHSIDLHDRRWKDGQSMEHDCMVLHTGLWYGRRCDIAYPHLCEKSIH